MGLADLGGPVGVPGIGVPQITPAAAPREADIRGSFAAASAKKARIAQAEQNARTEARARRTAQRQEELHPGKLSLQELQLKEARREEGLAPFKSGQVKAEAVEAVANSRETIYGLAQQGDEQGATELFQIMTGDPTATVTLPQNETLRSSGFVEVNSNGQKQFVDTASEERVKQGMKVQYDLIRDTNKANLRTATDDKKWVLGRADELLKSGNADNIQQAMQMARGVLNIVRASDSQRDSIRGHKPAKKLGEISQEANDSIMKAGFARQAVQAANEDVLNKSFVTLKPLTPAMTMEFDKKFGFLSDMGAVVLPAFAAVQNSKFASEPGFLGGKIFAAKKLVRQEPETFAALELITTAATFKKVLEIAATTFSAEIVKEVSKLVPTVDDRLDVAYAKISVMTALSASELLRTLDVWDSAEFNVKGFRQLMSTRLNTKSIANSVSTLDKDQAKEAMSAALSLVPKELRSDQRIMGAMVNSLPGPFKTAAIDLLAKEGRVPTETAEEVFLKDLVPRN